MDAIKELCDVGRALQALPQSDELDAIIKRLDQLTVSASFTLEALNPVFDTGNNTRGDLDLLTLCYNAFMIGRSSAPQNPEEARCDWFNDTRPIMIAGVERIQKECLERVEYAKKNS